MIQITHTTMCAVQPLNSDVTEILLSDLTLARPDFKGIVG